MSRTYTQEQIYQPAQVRLPRLQVPPPQGYQVAQPTQLVPAINPLLMAGAASAAANVDLNRRIREEAKVEAEQVFGPLYNRAPPADPEPPGPPGPEEPEEPGDDGDDRRPLIEDVNRIIERHPPPPGVSMETFRQFIFDVLARSENIGRVTDAIQRLMTSATLLYHIWTERSIRTPPDDDGLKPRGPNDPPGVDPPKKIKPVEERLNDPIPPQCFRHIYRDEKGQLRTIVICKTDGHAQRIYHDA